MSKTEKRAAEVIDQAVTGEELDSDKEPEAIETLNTFEAPRSNSWVATLLSVLACAAVGSGGWFMWTEVQTVKRSMKSVDEAIQSVNSQLVQIVSLQENARDIRSQMERLESGVARADERNQSVINRVETVAEELAKAQVDTRSSYVLAEAEYLLKLADQRLLIERNPETATNLMRTAQGLLAQLEDGRLLSVREQLAQDIQLLSAIPNVDLLGIQAELLALDSVLNELKLPVRRLSLESGSQTEDDVQKFIDDLSAFIRIREVSAPITPLVSASDAGRAREVLRLNLEQIKVALVREDQELFDAGLAQAKRLSRHFFDVTEGAGMRIMMVLSALEGIQIARNIPDAARGLRALKAYRDALTQERLSSGSVEQ